MISEVSLEKVTLWGHLAQVSPYAWMFSLTSLFLVFIGWLVTYNNSLKIASRSESKSLIDAVAKLINEINDISIDYWVNKSNKPVVNPFKKNKLKINKSSVTPGSKLFITTIYGKAKQTVNYIEVLQKRGLQIEIEKFSELLMLSMLDCEKSYSYSKNFRNDRAQDISSQSVTFMMYLYETFQLLHPPKKGFSIIMSIKKYCHETDEWYKDLEGR